MGLMTKFPRPEPVEIVGATFVVLSIGALVIMLWYL
jgi:hypothetical protein